ncbi:MAG: hypothetical protein MJ177_05910 [Clostridia bacterium]|nr:hypothetical protein [Clostridia bacterium]
MKKFRKTLALLLAIISIATTMFGFSIQASALTVSSKYPTQSIKGYTLSSAAKSAVVYSDSGLTKSIGYCYGTDDVVIEKIYSNNVVRIRVPWSGYSAPGRTCYAKLSDFWSTSYSVKILTVKNKTTCYTRKDLKTAKGSAWVNDRCYIVGENGNYYQALVPWETGCYRICWLNKSAFSHTHSYSSGYEAAHPHKSYKKCACGYYYYTGETRKLTNCKTCYPSTGSSSTYSISNNVITLKGVRLYEYPIGSKFSNSYYCNINGQSVNVKASQCYGFACYIEYKLHGCCWHTSSSHYPNLQGSENVRTLTTSKLKDLITKAGVGAHLRTNKLSSGIQHSMIVIGITSNGFTVADANNKGDLKVDVRTYTWQSYLDSSYGKVGFNWIEVYK